jgi:hypothetical protein
MTNRAKRLTFRVHAIQRTFERGVTVADVRAVLATGERMEEYPDDTPYPSRLVLGWCESRPIHVVCSENAPAREVIVVTVYQPDPERWEPDFKRRRS